MYLLTEYALSGKVLVNTYMRAVAVYVTVLAIPILSALQTIAQRYVDTIGVFTTVCGKVTVLASGHKCGLFDDKVVNKVITGYIRIKYSYL